MKCLLLAGAVLSISIVATASAVDNNGASTTTMSTQSGTPTPATAVSVSATSITNGTPGAPSWLDERGTITTEQVVTDLGITVTPEQRVQIERAVQRRNETLRAANAELSATLSKVLVASDGELAKRVADERERQRINRIRSRQPGRYNGMKK
jgi:hypothetical protein